MIDDKDLKVEPKLPWAAAERPKVPWIPVDVKFGKVILPPNDQKSNLDLPDKDVLQARDEPIGVSFAKPLSPGENRSVDWTPSLNKRQDY
jgi:hypothetical protein